MCVRGCAPFFSPSLPPLCRELETVQLTQQIDIMTHTIHRERERAAELELRARLFNFGKYKSDDKVGKKVADLRSV